MGTILSTVSVKLKLPGCQLEVVEGPNASLSQTFEQRRVKIGRSAELENDVVLDDDHSVSGFHCELIYDEDDGYLLRDHNSTNGVWLGDVRVYEAHLTTPVNLTMGDTVLRFTPLERIFEVTENLADQIVGFHFRDRQMRQLCVRARQLVQLGIDSILLYGETGAGKGAIASVLQHDCEQRDIPFETVNCAAIPENLLESELFGYTKGAFSGAHRDHMGAFKRADGGILFLDEVGELPLAQQAKLLTSLDKRRGVYEFRPIGSTTTERSNFLLLAGTNRELREELKHERFREDLYYRIAGCELRIPPLRERPGDIECLLEVNLDKMSEQCGERFVLSPEVRDKLMEYPWPGNVRELLHTINHAAAHALTADRSHLLVEDLPHQIQEGASLDRPLRTTQGLAVYPTDDNIPSYHEAKATVLENFQREYLSRLLDATDGNVSMASRISGMDRKRITTLKKKFFAPDDNN